MTNIENSDQLESITNKNLNLDRYPKTHQKKIKNVGGKICIP